MFTQLQLAKKLKALRQQKGYTQQQLASVLKVDRSTLSYYETGKTQPSLQTLSVLAELYHLPLAEMLDITLQQPAHKQ